MMDFQAVVLAGGFSKTLVPLVSKEVPKALLPVMNRPVILYVLELLEQNDLTYAIVDVEGESAALLISSWISNNFVDRLQVELQERAVLKDCQVGAGFVVTAGSEYKGEALAKKEKL